MVDGLLGYANGVSVLQQTGYDFMLLCIVCNFVKRVEVARIETKNFEILLAADNHRMIHIVLYIVEVLSN